MPSLGPRGEGWTVLQIILLLAVALSALAGPAWSGPARALVAVIGAALMGVGGGLMFRGTRDLGDALTPLPHPRDSASLVVSGVYARVRHPIYGGVILGCLGWSLVWASVAGLVLALVVALFFTAKSMREEAWLVERFPDYRDYRARTRRFTPWFG